MGRRGTLAAVVGAAGIVQLPTAAVVVALTQIHAEFGTSTAELAWTVTAFYIPETALLIAAGRISDIFGRKRMFLIGAVLFVIGSIIAAAAPSAEVLFGGIAISGIGAGFLMPSSMAILTNAFTGASRGTAIGYWGGATELVSGIGVVVGGVLTGELDWRWIFIVSAAIAGIVALLAIRYAPESRDPGAVREVDVPGVALLASGLTALTLALIQGAAWGWGSAAIVLLLVGAVAVFASFVVLERRSSHPIIDFEFFRRRNFAGATIVIFCLDFSFGALLFFLPQYFEEILGYSAIEAGALLVPLTGLMVVGSPLGGFVAARTGPRPPIVIGLASMAIGIFWISTLDLGTDFADLVVPTSMMGFGVGFSLTPMNLAAMNAVSRHHAGLASGMLVTLSGLGATLGVAVTGALFTSLNTDRTQEEVSAATGTNVTESQAEDLDGVLAGNSDAKKTFDEIVGKGEESKANKALEEAYVSALGTSLKVSAGLVLAGLILTVLLMRRQDPVDDDEPGELPPPVAAPPHRPPGRHWPHWHFGPARAPP